MGLFRPTPHDGGRAGSSGLHFVAWGVILLASLSGCSCRSPFTKYVPPPADEERLAIHPEEAEDCPSRGGPAPAPAASAGGTEKSHATEAHFPGRPWAMEATRLPFRRTAGEPRLVAAVNERAVKPQRTFEEAAMLVTLLASPAAGPNKTVQGQPELIRAIVAAPEANATPMGQANLVGLVDGSLLPAEEQTAVEAALAALTRLARVETEAVVVRAILRLRSCGRAVGGISPPTNFAARPSRRSCAILRRGCVRAWRPRPSIRSSPGISKRLCKVCSANRQSRTLKRFAVLRKHRGRRYDPRHPREKYIIAYSSQFIGRLLGIPEATVTMAAAGAARAPVFPAVKPPSRLDGPVEWRTGRSGQSPVGANGVVASAAGVSSAGRYDPDRCSPPGALRGPAGNWEDGPQSLTKVALAPQAFWEPGFWVSVKLLRPSWNDPPPRVPTRMYKPKKGRGDFAKASPGEG